MRIKHLFLILLFCVASIQVAQAQHAVHPENLNLDKSHHLAAGVVLGAIDYRLGCGVGLAKELSDEVFDLADATYTCAGALFSEWVGGGKSKLYRYNMVMIILDNISTDNVVRQGGFEVGVSTPILGHIPTTARLAVWTGVRLLMLEWTESWNRDMRDGFQWGMAIATTGVVHANYTVEFK